MNSSHKVKKISMRSFLHKKLYTLTFSCFFLCLHSFSITAAPLFYTHPFPPHFAFEKIPQRSNDPRIQRARLAAKKMAALKDTRISASELLKIAYFIETRLEKSIRRGKYYLPRKKTGLARSIEYDPETRQTFIHLQCHNGLKELGRGYFKVVTKSILYSHEHPEVVAHTEQPGKETREIKLLKKIAGLKGLVQLKAAMIQKPKPGKYKTSLMFTLYSPGALNHARLQKLSSEQKYQIALQTVEGLKGLHQNKIIHRDIKLDNVFIEKKGNSINCVLSDLGQAYLISEATNMTPHDTPCYMAPEGYLPSYKNLNYYKADIFSLGWVFYELVFAEKPRWMSTSGLFEAIHHGSNEKKEAFRRALLKEIDIAQKRLKMIMVSPQYDTHIKKIAKASFLMLEANPKQRASLDSLLMTLHSL
jgi:serine/threonine protein kinase